MKRRNFLKHTAFSIPLSLNGLGLSASNVEDWLSFYESSKNQENILVLIQLNGGNDGLNTFIPIDQYDQLFKKRKNILIPEKKLLSVAGIDKLKFNPSLIEMKKLFEDGKMQIIQNVGYPNPDKSHFRSRDIWTSASPTDEMDSTGWLGKYLKDEHEFFPSQYPNEKYPYPLAIAIDSKISSTCQSYNSNFSYAFNNPRALRTFDLPSEESLNVPKNSAQGRELAFVIESIKKANNYGGIVKKAFFKGNNLSEKYNQSNLARQLKTVARLISGGLQTKIYIVKQGGFDTHSSQVDKKDSSKGEHALLLKELSQSIGAFIEDLTLLGHDHKVLAMTFSEFGRRIASNASYGTDHGEAAPMMLFGTNVKPVVIGNNPAIAGTDKSLNVKMEIDFRSVYASVLVDLFSAKKNTIHQLLKFNFSNLNLFKG